MSDPVFGNEKRGSITDIPLPENDKRQNDQVRVARPHTGPQGPQSPDVKQWKSMKKRNKRTVPKIILVLVILLAIFWALSALLHKATVTVDPQEESVAIVQTFNAVDTAADGAVTFSRVSPFSASETLFIEGSVEENVQTKATGKILVKNETSEQQRFIATTRFETPDGLIYRTPRSIVIPANGETEVTVTADIPGDEYNSESGLTFTIPGLEGTASFNSFSATQVGAISGGFSGIITTATDEEIEAGKNTLEQELRQKLIDELLRKVPSGFIINEDLLTISEPLFSTSPNQAEGGIDITAEGTIEAVMFEKEAFDTFIASSVLTDYTPDQSVSITNTPDLTLSIVTEDFSVSEDSSFEFSLRSPKEGAQFQWNIEEAVVKDAIAGKDQDFIEKGLVEELSRVDSVVVEISPFWRSSLPNNVEKIELLIEE